MVNLNLKERLFTFEFISLAYILIAGALCWLLPIPEMVKAFLALPAFIIIPYLVGRSTLIPLSKFLNIKIEMFILRWCFGILSIAILAYFLNFFFIFNLKTYSIILLVLMGLCNFIKKEPSVKDKLRLFIGSYGGSFPILVSLILGVLGFIIIIKFAPYPNIGGCDTVMHYSIIVEIVQKGSLHFLGYYLSTHHLVIAMAIQFFNLATTPFLLVWLIQLVFFTLYSLGIYCLSYALSKKTHLALFSSLIGIFIFNRFFAPIFLFDVAPKTIILVLFPYLLLFINKELSQKSPPKKFKEVMNVLIIVLGFNVILLLTLYRTYNSQYSFSIVDLIGIILPLYLFIIFFVTNRLFNLESKKIASYFIILSLSLLIIHTLMGFLTLIFLLSYYLYFFLNSEYPSLIKPLLFSFSLILIFIFFLQFFNILPIPEIVSHIVGRVYKPIFVDQTLIGFSNLFNLLKVSYSSVLILTFILGCLTSIIFKNKKNVPLILLTLVLFIFFFTASHGMYRMPEYFNPLISFFSAFFIFTLPQLPPLKGKRVLFRYGVAVILILLVIITSVGNSLNELNKVYLEKGAYSCTNPFYHEVGNILKSETPLNSIILTYNDTSAYHAISAWSERSHLIPRFIDMPKCLKNVFLKNDSKETYLEIKRFLSNTSSDCVYYLAGISQYQFERRAERYTKIIEKKRKYLPIILLTSTDLVELKDQNIDKFYNTTYFTLLYGDAQNQIYIFGMNPEPGTPLDPKSVK